MSQYKFTAVPNTNVWRSCWDYLQCRRDRDIIDDVNALSERDTRRFLFVELLILSEVLGFSRWLVTCESSFQDMSPHYDIEDAVGVTTDGKYIFSEDEHDEDTGEVVRVDFKEIENPHRYRETIQKGFLQLFGLQISRIYKEYMYNVFLFAVEQTLEENWQGLEKAYPELWEEAKAKKMF